MSLFIPKRISELASIDSDLETPEKSSNKNFTKNAAALPKRINDIKESDSEDEDKLNCAILNDSFVLSPSKDIDVPCTPVTHVKKLGDSKDNVENQNLKSVASDENFIISRTNTLKISSPKNNSIQHQQLTLNEPRIGLKSRTQLFPPAQINNLKENVLRKAALPSSLTHQLQQPLQLSAVPLHHNDQFNKILATPIDKRLPLSTVKDTQKNHETPYKRNEPQFITPSTRAIGSTSIFKNSILSTTECDPIKKPLQQNQQPKILFRTPVARSLSSTLIQTPILEAAVTPAPKLSPVAEPEGKKEKPKENIITINNVDYEIDKKIGSGGSSSVFLARNRKSRKECAIKLVNLDGDEQLIEGYLNETKLLAKLQGNIDVVIALYDYCHQPEKRTLFMVMEKGESDLQKILQKYTSHMPLYTLVNYWHQILQAVNYIHQNGVIHSDLKPANFLMIGGRLKLIDFGIASNIATDSTSIIKTSLAGTYNYISPEALINTSNNSPIKVRLSTKSDVWSLGCILYQLLYKKTPFSHIKGVRQKIDAVTNPHTEIDYPMLPNFYPEILLEMLKKCLVHNPKKRSSVANLLDYPFHMIIPTTNK